MAAADKFRDGAAVAEGELLLRIDPADAQSDLLDAQAALADAEAQKAEAEEAVVGAEQELEAARKQLELGRQALERQSQLREKGYSTMVQVEQEQLSVAAQEQALSNRLQSVITARKRIERMDLAVARANIALQDAERTLAETAVTAPFAGTLDAVNATLGRRVSPTETLAVLIDPTALEARFSLSTSQYSRFLDEEGGLLNMPVEVDLTLGERTLTVSGTLDRAAAVVADGEAGRTLFASLDLKTGISLRPGDFVTVRLQEPVLDNVAVLPAAAATEDGRILVLGADNRLEDVKVRVIRRMGDEIVVADAPFGRSYVSERIPYLGSGLKVIPRSAPTADSEDLLSSAEDGLPAPSSDTRAAAADMIELDPARREALLVKLNESRMPEDVKNRLRDVLDQPMVPARVVRRIENGGRRG